MVNPFIRDIRIAPFLPQARNPSEQKDWRRKKWHHRIARIYRIKLFASEKLFAQLAQFDEILNLLLMMKRI